MQRLIGLGLILGSLVVGYFVADGVLRLLRLPKDSARVMLLSGSTLTTDKFGVRRYEANKSVEQAGYIGSKVAYRYKYRTNNLGFVSEFDFPPEGGLDLLFVGDSMTEGQEAGPWLDELQRTLLTRYHVTTQNAGIAGNGFVEFEKAATFAKSQLGAKRVMIIFIPDDMYRFGDKMVANQDCSTYETYTSSVINCNSGRPTWYHYDANFSDSELASFAESKLRFGFFPTLRRPVLDAARWATQIFCKTGIRVESTAALANRINSECDAIAKRIVSQPGSAGSDAKSSDAAVTHGVQIPQVTVSSLRKILQLYGVKNVLMVMIPGGGYSFKVIQPQVYLTELFGKEFGVDPRFVDISDSCEMPPSYWGKGGGHPTAEGYRKLQSCFLSNRGIMQFATE